MESTCKNCKREFNQILPDGYCDGCRIAIPAYQHQLIAALEEKKKEHGQRESADIIACCYADAVEDAIDILKKGV